MKKICIFIFMLLILAISACSSITVSQDYDLGKPLPVMKTYQWETTLQAKTGDVRVDNPLLDSRIRKAVDRVFSEKGFQQLAVGTPDFKVVYQFSITRQIKTDDLHTGFGFGLGSYGRHGGMVISSGAAVTQYDQGFLVIDLTDVKSGSLLWRGNGTWRLTEHSDPERTEKIVNEIVAKILAQFPPETQ